MGIKHPPVGQRLSDNAGSSSHSRCAMYLGQLTGDSIRVLELLPGTGRQKIVCRHNTVSLSTAADTCEAISYAWGDANDTREIECNGQTHRITNNLARALVKLRGSAPRLLWADALCINQGDDEEKGQQVRMMGEVYEKAKGVLVWLDFDSCRVAQDCFSLIPQTNEFLGAQLAEYGEPGLIPPLEESSAIEHDVTRWDKVRKLVDLPWFGRLWVLQEAELAKECTMAWGNARMAFAEYVEFSLSRNERVDLRAMTGPMETARTNSAFRLQLDYGNTPTWRTSKPLCAWMHQSMSHGDSSRTTFISVPEAARLILHLATYLARTLLCGWRLLH